MNIKNVINIVSFGVGGVLGYLFGPMDALFQGMLVLMVLDFALGIVMGAVGKSTKTNGGKLSSQAMFSGVAKKVGELAMVIVGNVLDSMTGMAIVRAGVCAAIAVSEVLSITENASILGVIDIPVINKALEILKGKAEGEE